MRAAHGERSRAPRGEQSSVPLSHRLPAAVCNRFTCPNPSDFPFRPQMEPKKSSSQHQPQAMELKGKKSSPRGAAAAAAAEAESPLSSLFNPPAQGANEKDQDLYRILYKGQSGGGQAGMTDGKTQWSPSKSRTAHNKDGKHSQTYDSVDTSCFGSSVHYGGRDYYGGSATMQTTESSNEYKGDKKDPATDSHGDWWQGSFYY